MSNTDTLEPTEAERLDQEVSSRLYGEVVAARTPSSVFPGRPAAEPPAPPATLQYRIYVGSTVRTVEVDYLAFSTTHVMGYLETPEGQYDKLVIALRSSDVREIVPSEPDTLG